MLKAKLAKLRRDLLEPSGGGGGGGGAGFDVQKGARGSTRLPRRSRARVRRVRPAWEPEPAACWTCAAGGAAGAGSARRARACRAHTRLKPSRSARVAAVGDARVGLVGFPSVGKSTLLTKITGTFSEAAGYGALRQEGAGVRGLRPPVLDHGQLQRGGGLRRVSGGGRGRGLL